MLTKRIIPCLDIKNGRTVKGVNFEGLVDAGDPVDLAKRYALEGADELVFLDITATVESRATRTQWVGEVAQELNIPFTVGGGIASVEDAAEVLAAGADKISLNSAAFNRPNLINEVAERYGNQCVVVAVDVKLIDGKYTVFLSGGRKNTGADALEWIQEAVRRGAGEILLTSMDADGTKNGYDLPLCKAVTECVDVPVIASGGAGCVQDFQEVFKQTTIDAALAASVFHFGEIEIQDLKKELAKAEIEIRI
jgi:cyclase